MAVEYDLVILGGSRAALQAAIAAARLQARVALVMNPQEDEAVDLWHHSLREVGRQVHQASLQPWMGIGNFPRAGLRLGQAMQWAETVVATLTYQQSPAQLAALGVDVIVGEGAFQPSPLQFRVQGRSLRGRNFLIAVGTTVTPPPIPGLATADPWYPRSLRARLHATPESWPHTWAILGSSPGAVEWAQTLNRCGCQVTLLVPEPHLLPQEDGEAAAWIQAQLEAEGVRILTHCQVTQVKGGPDTQKHIWTTNEHLEAEAVLLTLPSQPAVEGLNLEGVGVRWSQRGIQVNPKLQTTHPRIYACGDGLGGYSLSQVAQYEAGIALKNALFWPRFRVNYHSIPWAVFTDPELARMGLTEAQARRHYGGAVRVVRQFYKTLARTQMRNEGTGFCKLIGDSDGRLLGAHLVGPAASETINLLALAIQKGLKIQELATLGQLTPTFSEIVSQTAAQWHQREPRSQPIAILETFFNLRRTWFP